MIILTLVGDDLNEYKVKTHIKKTYIDYEWSPEAITKEIPKEIKLWKDVFMCGYGVHIGDGSGLTFDEYQPLIL